MSKEQGSFIDQAAKVTERVATRRGALAGAAALGLFTALRPFRADAQQIAEGVFVRTEEFLYGPDHTGRILAGQPFCWPDTFSLSSSRPDQAKMLALEAKFPTYFNEGDGICFCEWETSDPLGVGKKGEFVHTVVKMSDAPGLCSPLPEPVCPPIPECPQPEQPSHRVCEEVYLAQGQEALMNAETSTAMDGKIEVTQPDGTVEVFQTNDTGQGSGETSHLTLVTFDGIEVLPPGQMVKYRAEDGPANIYCPEDENDDYALCNNVRQYLEAWKKQGKIPSVFNLRRDVNGWWNPRRIQGAELEQFMNEDFCRSYRV